MAIALTAAIAVFPEDDGGIPGGNDGIPRSGPFRAVRLRSR
jgi:hypothetical protein